MPQLFLDVAFVDFCRTRETGAQAVPGKQREADFLGQVGSNSRVQDRALDQARNMLIVQPRPGCAFAVPRCAHEDRAEVDPGKMQPLLKRVYGAGLVLGAATDLDLAPAGSWH